MTVRLFQRTRFRGDSAIISGDEDDLADLRLGRNPSSMTMGEHDAVLLFSRAGWRGSVMYRRGRNDIENLRSRRAGGRAGFGRSITSVRITPFFVRFSATVVTRSDGTLPGGFAKFDDIEAYLQAMITELNAWYDRERALLRADIARVIQRDHDANFDLTIAEAAAGFPAAWRNSREIDLIIVNSFENAAMAGLARAPWRGEVVITALRSGGPNGSRIDPACLATNVANFARLSAKLRRLAALDSERLVEPSAQETSLADRLRRTGTIMTQALEPIAARHASVDQIQQWHHTLSRNPTRRRDP
jgi:hypothetical protein